MTQLTDTPNFKSWTNENLVNFAAECYAKLLAEQSANEQLKIDLKDAMKLARIENMKHNTASTQNHTGK
jgi:hypothetical protein